MQRARNAAPLTHWDGDLSSAISPSGRIGLSNREVFSPTRLQTWATCPFRYFLSNVLGIAAPEQPEELATISALERGSLLHKILERFILTAQQQNAIPAPDQPWTDDQRRQLFTIAEEEFQHAEQRGVTGKPLLWEMVRDEMVSDLARFLREDDKQRKKTWRFAPCRRMRLRIPWRRRFRAGGRRRVVESPHRHAPFSRQNRPHRPLPFR